MNKFKVAILAIIVLSLQIIKPVPANKIYVPANLKNHIELLKTEFSGNKAGWLKVFEKNNAKVLVVLKGKSFYNPNCNPKDYEIEYWGYSTNGVPSKLPKGLYYWKTTGNQGKVMPGLGNRYKGYEFDFDASKNKNGWYSFKDSKKQIIPQNCQIKWNSNKAKWVNPTKYVHNILKLMHK